MHSGQSRLAPLLIAAGLIAVLRELLFGGLRSPIELAEAAAYYLAAGAVFSWVWRQVTPRPAPPESSTRRRTAAAPPDVFVGPMTAGIVHNFRNYLAILTGSLAMLRRATFEGPAVQRALQIQEKCLAQAEHLATLLLEYSRTETERETRIGEVVPSTLIDDAVELAGLFIKERKVQIIKHVETALPPILADEAALMQSLINVLKNAKEASQQGGEVEISATLADDGHAVYIAVRDYGLGVAPEIADRIFTPFSSTKENGTGLGLFTVKTLVQQSGGSLTVNSEHGAGTEVIIGCPTAHAVAQPGVQNPVLD